MSGITSFKEKLTELYQSKAPNEQKMILALLVCVVLFFSHTIYNAIAVGIADTSKKLDKQLALNQWVTEQIAILKGASQGSVSSSNSERSITQVINTSARKYKITIERLQPQKSDLVKVGLADVEFNALMKWLAELSNRYGVNVVNFDVSQADSSGVVKVRRLDLGRD